MNKTFEEIDGKIKITVTDNKNTASIKYAREIARDLYDVHAINALDFSVKSLEGFLRHINTEGKEYEMVITASKSGLIGPLDEWVEHMTFRTKFRLVK